MSKLLRADFYRMFHGKKFWLCLAAMLASAMMFIVMQHTSMDYVVALDRVIFLPMSFYGITVAALISLFVGDDFSDGVIRNKIVSGRGRAAVYLSNLISSWSACLMVYLISIIFTYVIGLQFFENNVSNSEFVMFLVFGMFSSLALGSIFCMITMLTGNKSLSVMICMGLAFFMLFLCLHTNQIIVQEPYKNGVVNPHYMGGVKRVVYEILHDLNPFGQAAQLSSMESLNPIRWIGMDIFWIGLASVFGNFLFLKKDIQ